MRGAPGNRRSYRDQLVPYDASDIDTLQALWGLPEVRKYLFDDEIWSREQVAEAVRASLELWASDGLGQWTIRLIDAPAEVIGFVGFAYFFEPPELQLIWGLDPRTWGCGYATEAARAAIAFGFELAELREIVAATDAPNVASVAVMERLGMQFRERRLEAGQETLFYVKTPGQ